MLKSLFPYFHSLRYFSKKKNCYIFLWRVNSQLPDIPSIVQNVSLSFLYLFSLVDIIVNRENGVKLSLYREWLYIFLIFPARCLYCLQLNWLLKCMLTYIYIFSTTDFTFTQQLKFLRLLSCLTLHYHNS